MSQWPACGLAGCDARATHVDTDGVGFCADHKYDGLHSGVVAAETPDDFDPWWLASCTLPGFDKLDYGIWPVGTHPPAGARSGWGSRGVATFIPTSVLMSPDLRKALDALYLEAPEGVVDDIKARVQAALDAGKEDPLVAFKRPVEVLDQGFVRLVDVYGGEATILRAARVTSGSESKGSAEDRGLLRYLMRHRHSTPLEFASVVLHVRVPMDVWRQWIRHRTATTNEYSTRYSEAIDAMAATSEGEWRMQATSNRQGSSGLVTEWPDGYRIEEYEVRDETLRILRTPLSTTDGHPHRAGPGAYLSKRERAFHMDAQELYKERLAFGVAKEQARKDLPLSNYTEAYWSIDLHNLLHFLGLRLDEHAQLEIRLYAQAIAEIVKVWVPNVWEAFVDYRLDAHTFSRQEMVGVRKLVCRGIDDAALQAAHHGVEFDRVAYVRAHYLQDVSKREQDAFLKALAVTR